MLAHNKGMKGWEFIALLQLHATDLGLNHNSIARLWRALTLFCQAILIALDSKNCI